MSIGTVILLIGALWAAWEAKFKIKGKRQLIVFVIYFLWIGMTYFWTRDHAEFWHDWRIKLPFLLIPLAFAFLPSFSKKQNIFLLISYGLSQLVIVTLTILGYAQDWESNIERVKKNGALEIFAGTNHIYFGVTLAVAILIGLHLLLHRKRLMPQISTIWPFLFVILSTLGLHSLTSRTGMVAFYGGLFTYLLFFILKQGKWKLGLGILVILIILPLGSYQLIPSFKYRVDVTLWDLRYSQEENADLNFQSVGLRIKTWGCSWEIFKENPVVGVGFGDTNEMLFACYERIQLNADRSKWLDSAHNQYLEQMVGGGAIALLLLLLVLSTGLKRKWRQNSELMIAFLALMCAAMLSESILERQLGINLFLMMFFLLGRNEDF